MTGLEWIALASLVLSAAGTGYSANRSYEAGLKKPKKPVKTRTPGGDETREDAIRRAILQSQQSTVTTSGSGATAAPVLGSKTALGT